MIKLITALIPENRYLVIIKLVVMDSIKAAKYELIQEIMGITDNELIGKVKEMLQSERQTSPWDELTENQKDFLLKSIESGEQGNIIPHEEVMAKVKLKYGV